VDEGAVEEMGPEDQAWGEDIFGGGVTGGVVPGMQKKGRWKRIKDAFSRFYHGVLCATEAEHSRKNAMPKKVS
jgi:hypothetical protein